jgi:hypothetical protein
MTRAFVVDRSLCQRILAEYRELPGLRLSVRQAARLWSLELEYCQATLDLLVAEGSLARSARHEYCTCTDRARTTWSRAPRSVSGSAA